MATWGNADCSEMKALQGRIERELDEIHRQEFLTACCHELAARLLSLTIPATPVGKYPKRTGKKGGTLRRGWGAATGAKAKEYAYSLPVEKSGDTYTIEIINPVKYASYVEFGHRTRSGGWVKGRYMLTASEKELEKVAPKVLEKLLEKKLKEVFHGWD